MNRKTFAIIGMVGLVGVEIAMGLFSKSDTVSNIVLTMTLVFVLIVGSMLQATLLKFTLEHRSRNNWRQIPCMMIQATLFVLIAYWAHKGLGNTLFTGWSDWQLWLAGLGLGLITMFGPEVINEDYEGETDQTESRQEIPQMVVRSDFAARPTPAYQIVQTPLSGEKNGHSIDLNEAARLVEH